MNLQNRIFVTLLLIIKYRAYCVDICDKIIGFHVCSSYGFSLVEGKFGTETHCLCLKHKDLGSSPILTLDSSLLLEPEADDGAKAEGVPVHNITMSYGFPLLDPASGSAEGYIGDDHNFYGILHLGNRTLFADPYNRHTIRKTFGSFENDNVNERRRREYSQPEKDMAQIPPSTFPYTIKNKTKKIKGIAPARICDLLLLADFGFYVKDANSSLNHAVRRMIHAVAQADIIFRNTDFDEDGIPDNIGFSVKYILVLTSEDTNTRLFGDLVADQEVDGRNYLMKFARLRRLSEVCLGVAFSGYSFMNRTLGLSFTSLGGGMGGTAGGLCDRRAFGHSFNTLVVAHSTSDDRTRVPERLAAITLAHEIGHSFGAHHDDNFPNKDCYGYLMSSQSSVSENPLHFQFSLCSKRLMSATLNSMSYCLRYEDRPYCGNGIVEEGESCDCGLPSQCHSLDPCCTPRAGGVVVYEEGALHKDGCLVAPSAMCHPSQGTCCASNCQYADLSADGINCKTSGQECLCPVPDSDCRCGLGGRCLTDGTCQAAECARLGLAECLCPKKGAGGAVADANRCGVCCQLPLSETGDSGEDCVGAEYAVQAHRGVIPFDWPDPEYKGPNVTIEVCHSERCSMKVLRAWREGDVCVSRNTVGKCTARGVCKPVMRIPRSNIYPIFVKQKQMSSKQPAVFITENNLILIIICLYYYILYT